jgi:hypothetical protein
MQVVDEEVPREPISTKSVKIFIYIFSFLEKSDFAYHLYIKKL